MAEGLSNYPVDTLPIQIVGTGGRGDVTTLSKAKIADSPPGFIAFVTRITEHIAFRLAQENLYLANKDNSLLQFMSWPINSGIPDSVSKLETRSSPAGSCRISSPWIDILIERKPAPSVRAIARYNERQLLIDQAILAGVSDVSTDVAMPLGRNEFNRYADLEYELTEIRRQPALKPIEERVPPDLLWLFRRAWQDSPGRFSGPAGASMRKAMEIGADGYTQIVIALIDRCFASEGADIHYGSILDVSELVSLEQYKIVTPLIVKPVR